MLNTRESLTLILEEKTFTAELYFSPVSAILIVLIREGLERMHYAVNTL